MDLKVLELFAGVGGFRIGLERVRGFQVVMANQWGPSKKNQDAFNCYISHFCDNGLHVNKDIAEIEEKEVKEIDVDLIAGGFPCQDFSVARSLSSEKDIKGKKGVLFWEIMRLVRQIRPKYVLLENVDRLLKIPSKQLGRDFSIMLASFRDANYSVEWRVINAAEYGQAQSRRRIYIFAIRNDNQFIKERGNVEASLMLSKEGFFADIFPVLNCSNHKKNTFILPTDLVEISQYFSSRYFNAGIMRNGVVHTEKLISIKEEPQKLGKILQTDVDEKYYLDENTIKKFEYIKGPKRIERTTAHGYKYFFSEGGMAFPDPLNKPGRSILSSEGKMNRFSHIVEDPETSRLRFLTPVECERLNGFPDDWTQGMSDRMRYFCMGNASVVGLIEKMGQKIKKINWEMEKVSIHVSKQINSKDSESTKKRLANVIFCENLPRENLEYNHKERQILIYQSKQNEILYLQYPGQKTALEKNPTLYDVRPKIELSNGNYSPDLLFKNIWDAIFDITVQIKENREIFLELLSVEFYKIAYMQSHDYIEKTYKYNFRDLDIKGSTHTSIYQSVINKEFYKYQPDRHIISQIESIYPNILDMSWEAFFVYNDLLAFNEDCHYYHQSGENAFVKGAGRVNNLLTHIGVIGVILGKIKFTKLLDRIARIGVYAPNQEEIKSIIGKYFKNDQLTLF